MILLGFNYYLKVFDCVLRGVIKIKVIIFGKYKLRKDMKLLRLIRFKWRVNILSREWIFLFYVDKRVFNKGYILFII